MANTGINIQQIIEDSKNVLLKPKEYFTSMPKKGGFVEPIVKALIYGALAGILGLIWSIAGLAVYGGMFGGGGGIMVLVSALIGSVVGLFIGAVIILVLSAICGGSTDFEANTRVSASLMVLYPINALFGFTGGIHYSLLAIISVVVGLYGIYLLYTALVHALGGKEGTAKIIAIILAALSVLMLLSSLVCSRAVTSQSENWMRKSEAMREEMEKSRQSADEAMKKINELRNKIEESSGKE